MEAPVSGDPAETTTLTLSFDATRTALVNGKTAWTAGDKVEILNSDGTYSQVVEVPAAQDGKTSFDVEVKIKDSRYFAVYPVSAADGVTGGKLKINLASSTTGRFADANVCAATSEGSTLSMKNVTAVMKINVNSGNSVEVVQIASKNALAGKYTVDFGEAGVEVAKTTDTVKTAKIVTGGIDGDYYLAVAPGTYLSGFAITALKGNGGYQTIDSKSDNVVAVNKIVDLGTIGNDLSDGLSGEGTEASPYLIKNAGEFVAFTSSVNLGNPYAGKFISLQTDLSDDPVATSIGFYTAADVQAAFAGTFLGNGHTIKVAISGTTYAALFGVVDEGAAVKDLKVIGTATGTGNYTAGVIGYVRGASGNRVSVSKVSSEVVVSSSGNRIGGVIGYAQYTDVDECSNAGSVTGLNSVAGVVGKGTYVNIKNSTNSAAVKSTGTTDTRILFPFNGSVYLCGSGDAWNSTTGTNATGGVAGFIDHGSLSDCTNSATVNGYSKVGGVVGGTYWTPVSKCKNTSSGAVTATASWLYNIASQSGYGFGSTAGGVVGWMHASGAISECENAGTVSGKGGLGGIVGLANCNSNSISAVSITDCRNSGVVESKGTGMGGATKNLNPSVGGIVGSAAAFGEQKVTISGCENSGNVSTDGIIAGGIVGRLVQSRNNGSVINLVENCVNSGNVTALYWVGGIAGLGMSMYNGVTRFTNCANSGVVTAERTDDNEEDAGGILGANYCWNSSKYSSWGQVYNSYNTGDVYYKTTTYVKPYAGGIMGRLVSAGSVKNCYNTGFVGPVGKVEVASGAEKYLGALVGSHEVASGLQNSYYLDGVCAQAVGTASTKAVGGAISAFNRSATGECEFSGVVSYNDSYFDKLIDILNAWVTKNSSANLVLSPWKASNKGPVFE